MFLGTNNGSLLPNDIKKSIDLIPSTSTLNTTTTTIDPPCFNNSFENFLPHLRCQEINGLEIGSLPDNLHYIIGIPTVKRKVETYLYKTIQSILAATDAEGKLLNIFYLSRI